MIKKLKTIWYFAKRIWRGYPVRSWRQCENGKYLCDGDCGKWTLHGVCTCGLCHYYRYHGRYDLVERDNVSWRREAQTEEVMMGIPRIEYCKHGVHINDRLEKCEPCIKEFEQMRIELEKIFK